MRALVTGSAGFIGRHFVDRLESSGLDITAIDIVNPRPVDCRDFFAVDDNRYDLIVHCAAIVGGRAKIDGDPLAIATNMGIDTDAFRYALRTRAHRFVYFSSSAAYPVEYQQLMPRFGTFGETRNLRLLAEQDIVLGMPRLPDQTYGWAKFTGEVLAERAQAEGLRVHVFRPFSGYGADQSLDYPFPSFIARARSQADPFDVWGNGEQVRDWIHVDDIVEAVFTAIMADVAGPVNLGTGVATTFNHFARMLTDAPLRHHLDAPVGVHYRVADTTKLFTFYQPKITLEEGIRMALS